MVKPSQGASGRQVQRLLTLVPLLHSTGGPLSTAEAAQQMGVSKQQIMKDLRVLFMVGLPGGLPDDLIEVDIEAAQEGLIVVSNADYLTRPMRLTPTEASTLLVALATMRTSAEPEAVEVIDRAMAKLESAGAQGAASAAGVHVADRDAGEQSPWASVINDALAQQRRLALEYLVPARDEHTSRTVSPRALVTHDGVRYLDAWCHEVEGQRSFRLDRIESATLLDEAADVPEEQMRDLAETLFRPGAEAPLVTLRLAPGARWVAEYHPIEASRELSGGDLEVDLRVGDERWLRRLLLRVAPHAEVVAPQEFTELFHAAAQETLRLYTSQGVR